MEVITIKEVLASMSTGNPFSLSYVTYDRSRKKGGQIKHVEEAELVMRQTIEGRPLTKKEASITAPTKKKNPNHSENYTRNIRILQDGQATSLIKKIHPPLILTFNQLQVVA